MGRRKSFVPGLSEETLSGDSFCPVGSNQKSLALQKTFSILNAEVENSDDKANDI